MNYEDSWSWPEPPVDEIDRSEIKTVYSFGHYDGPASGLIRWQCEFWWFARFSNREQKYWIVKLTHEEQAYLFRRGAEWAHFFHNDCSYNGDGTRLEKSHVGAGCIKTPNGSIFNKDGAYESFNKKFPHFEPKRDAIIVGYFENWRSDAEF